MYAHRLQCTVVHALHAFMKTKNTKQPHVKCKLRTHIHTFFGDLRWPAERSAAKEKKLCSSRRPPKESHRSLTSMHTSVQIENCYRAVNRGEKRPKPQNLNETTIIVLEAHKKLINSRASSISPSLPPLSLSLLLARSLTSSPPVAPLPMYVVR